MWTVGDPCVSCSFSLDSYVYRLVRRVNHSRSYRTFLLLTLSTRDMEPLVRKPVFAPSQLFEIHFITINKCIEHIAKVKMHANAFCFFEFSSFNASNHSMRLRGGGPYPSNDKNFNAQNPSRAAAYPTPQTLATCELPTVGTHQAFL